MLDAVVKVGVSAYHYKQVSHIDADAKIHVM